MTARRSSSHRKSSQNSGTWRRVEWTRNGLGWSHQQTSSEIVRIEEFLSVLIESADVYSEWKRLLGANGVTGVQAQDARLVAAMNVYGVRRMLTFTTEDFTRYPDIEVIRPA